MKAHCPPGTSVRFSAQRTPDDSRECVGVTTKRTVMTSALAGIRVLDLSGDVAGPYCASVLADYGADVIKVEPPGKGDVARHVGPFPDRVPDPERSARFLHLNTNKRSVTLDITR